MNAPLSGLAADPVTVLRGHFAAAVALLRASEPRHLDGAQRLVRKLLLDAIEGYAYRGVFPRNRHFPGERKPTFVDEDGTHCAVAHLLDLTGQSALVQEVRLRRNFAAVSEMAENARFADWAREVGFTVEELALLQPAYCDIARYECVCEQVRPLEANEALAVVVGRDDGTFEVTEVLSSRLPLAKGSIGVASRPAYSAPSLVRLAYVEDLGVFDVQHLMGARGDGPSCGIRASSSLPLTYEQAAEALLSAGPRACADYLRSLDQRWDETGRDIDPVLARCRPGIPEAVVSPGRSCTLEPAPLASSESLSLLALVLATLAARRLVRG